MTFDTIIRGGTVATASDTFAADVGISGGRIAALGHDLGDAGQIIDATGRLVLPGGIDSHVHLAEIRVTTAESRFAACLNRLLQQNLPQADIPEKYQGAMPRFSIS